MLSALYDGQIRHVRTGPVRHRFDRRLGMLAIDLDEWDQLFRGRWAWGHRGWFPWSVRRRDHLGDPRVPLKRAVQDWFVSMGRPRPEGRIVLLTMPATFGFAMNPVSFYFCLDRSEQPTAVVAEVNNTPWGEQHCYLLDAATSSSMEPCADKAMHVSPFLPMDMSYGWKLDWQPDRLRLVLNCLRQGDAVLSVSVDMTRKPWTGAELRRWSRRHPIPGWSAWLGIYLQAVRLKLKGVPVFAHPRSRLPLVVERKGT